MGDNALRSLQRERQLIGILLGRDNPQRQRQAALRGRRNRSFQHRKRPDHHRHQIGRERQGWRKTVDFEAIFQRPGYFGSIADRYLPGLGPQGHGERRLEAGLIERGEGRAAVDRFELSPAIPVIPDLDPEHPGRAGFEWGVIIEGEGNGSGGERLGKSQPGNAGCIEHRPAARKRLAANAGHRLADRKIAAVEIDEFAGGFKRRLNLDMTRKAFLRRVHRQIKAIGGGPYSVGQLAQRHRRGCRNSRHGSNCPARGQRRTGEGKREDSGGKQRGAHRISSK